jgi:hypothetical protein
MQVTRQDNQFADAVDKLLAGHRTKAFSVVTADGKQERGYAPVTIGKDFFQCRSGTDDNQNDRIYPMGAIISITPSG